MRGKSGQLIKDDSPNVLRVRDKANDFLLSIQDDNGRSHMMIVWIELFSDPESIELRIGFDDGRIGSSVVRR